MKNIIKPKRYYFKNILRKKHYLSIVTPVKYDDVKYLEEFIIYYLHHGVEHFYFYAHEHPVPLEQNLKKYLNYCTIHSVTGTAPQMAVYKHWFKNYKNHTKWIAVFDTDEFVLPHLHKSFAAYLKENEKYASIAINWKMFGYNFHLQPPDGLVLKNYQTSAGSQYNVYKCVTQTKFIEHLQHNPHRPFLKAGYQVVNAKGNPVVEDFNDEYCIDIIQLNHYYTKSLDEYHKKIHIRKAHDGERRVDQTYTHFWLFQQPIISSIVYDTDIWDKYGCIFDKK